MTAASAINGIYEVDPDGTVGLITSEPNVPYNRPPLSKALWKGEPVDSIWRKVKNKAVEIHLDTIVKEIDPTQRQVFSTHQEVFSYEKLLFATGVRPRQLPYGDGAVLYFRTLTDYQKLRAMSEHGNRFAVIGGGFIGSEIAAALTLNNKKVLMFFPGKGIGDRIFPPDLSHFINDYYKKRGIEFFAGEQVLNVKKDGDAFLISTVSQKDIAVDGIVAGIGSIPNTELAQAANISENDGILVNEYLQTNMENIYSAGDVASFFNPALQRRMRVEHEDNAITMGYTAGKNMAGLKEQYTHLPFFYSDMFELGYEAVGEIDASYKIYEDWKEPYKEGVVYYLKDDRVRGVLLWNVWGKVDEARALIAESGPWKTEDLKDRIQ